MGLSPVDPGAEAWLKWFHSPECKPTRIKAKQLAMELVEGMSFDQACTVDGLAEEIGERLDVNPEYISLEVYFEVSEKAHTWLMGSPGNFEIFVRRKRS